MAERSQQNHCCWRHDVCVSVFLRSAKDATLALPLHRQEGRAESCKKSLVRRNCTQTLPKVKRNCGVIFEIFEKKTMYIFESMLQNMTLGVVYDQEEAEKMDPLFIARLDLASCGCRKNICVKYFLFCSSLQDEVGIWGDVLDSKNNKPNGWPIRCCLACYVCKSPFFLPFCRSIDPPQDNR